MNNVEMRALLAERNLYYLIPDLPLSKFEDGLCGPCAIAVDEVIFTYTPYPAWVVLWRIRAVMYVYTRAFMDWLTMLVLWSPLEFALKARLQQQRRSIVWIGEPRQLELPLAG